MKPSALPVLIGSASARPSCLAKPVMSQVRLARSIVRFNCRPDATRDSGLARFEHRQACAGIIAAIPLLGELPCRLPVFARSSALQLTEFAALFPEASGWS